TAQSAAARPDATARPHTPQGGPTAAADRQADCRSPPAAAQAPGMAGPRAALALAADPGVGDDRPRVHERRPDLYTVPDPNDGDRPDRGDDRGGAIRW